MSTEHQQYSIENQGDAIQLYAERRGMTIVRRYADSGKSGLRIGGREALQRLIRDVQSGEADFTAILVYDVSRWGRFQDADESAYYEYICRRAGISVHYCAEQFDNEGSPVATIVKGVKRAMAGEYSRELSAKVFAGQCRLIELGFRQGGAPRFGLRRTLLDQTGNPKGVLSRGEQKSLQTDRVILTPGPVEEEIEVVGRIYRMFVEDSKVESEIANRLSTDGIRTDLGREWTRSTVRQVLTNPKYIGDNVYNRVSFKLKKKRVVNPHQIWIHRDSAFKAIVEPSSFYMAQGIIRERNRRYTDLDAIRASFSGRCAPLTVVADVLTSHRLVDDGADRAALVPACSYSAAERDGAVSGCEETLAARGEIGAEGAIGYALRVGGALRKTELRHRQKQRKARCQTADQGPRAVFHESNQYAGIKDS